MVGTNPPAPIQNRRANAFSDIFGRPPASNNLSAPSTSSLQHQPSYRGPPPPSNQIRNSPNLNNNNNNNNIHHNNENSYNQQLPPHPSNYQQYYQSPQSNQRSTSGGSYRDSDLNSSGGQRYQNDQNYSNYQQQQQQQPPQSHSQQNYDNYGGNNHQGSSNTNYRPYGSISGSSNNQYNSPEFNQGGWQQSPQPQQQQQQLLDQNRSSFSSSTQSHLYSEDHNYPSPDLAGRQLQHQNSQQFNSPQSNYPATLTSGPPSASTSNTSYTINTPSPSLSYSYLPSSNSNQETNNNNLSVSTSSSTYSVPSLPPSLPVLPEFLSSDDFYGFESSREVGGDEQSIYSTSNSVGGTSSKPGGLRRDSGNSIATTNYNPALDETDAFDSYSAYPSYQHDSNQVYERSRRDSGDSDATSLYRSTPPSFDQRPLLALNPSVVSLATYASPSIGSSSSTYNYNPNQTTSPSTTLSRRSSESVRGMSHPITSGGIGQDRAYSFSTSSERPEFRTSPTTGSELTRPYSAGAMTGTTLTPSSSSIMSNSTITTTTTNNNPTNPLPPQRAPVVYPALLSRVAEAFKTRIVLTERVKDGLVYSETFDGRDAVDKIAYIIKTTDRNLALLLGRALDAQKFFHDVTYDHRLRDSAGELYQFKERLSILSQEELDLNGNPINNVSNPTNNLPRSGVPPTNTSKVGSNNVQRKASTSDTILEDTLPSGVFTLLTDCYSPTCTRDRLCYSIACPRRLEQQARLNLKPKPGLKRSLSSESLGDLREPGSLWIHSVPQDIIDSTSDSEKKRQEALNEVFYTERDFVRDMEYLRDSWIKPLRTQNIIPEARREDFVTQVFWNVLEIYAVNVRLAEMLNKRQKTGHVVEKVGDIFLEMVPHFGPFVKYGAHQLYGKYEFEKEKGSNPVFAKFVDDTERLPESKKLELNGYLTKPTTRLARYPLLLEACLKNTPDDNPDKIMLPKVVKLVREFLNSVNIETGRSENRFNLAQLDQQLVFKNGEAVDLRLRDEDREMIFKGPLKKRGGTQSESAELQVFLFDHAILMVKQKAKNEQYKVYRKPIPLELLVVVPMDDPTSIRAGAVRPRSLMSRGANARYLANPPPGVDKNSKQGFAMTFVHLGRRGYQITVWSASWAGRKKWLEKIEARQQELRERSLVFETLPLSAGYFVGTNRVTCAAPFDNGNRMVYGTDNGVYLSNLNQKNKVPVKVISVPNVTQLDVLEEQGILIVLADKAVQTFFVDNLDPGDAVGAAKRARKISSHATFFKAGQCLGRTLVCVVKSGSVSSTIKTLEPIDQVRGKKQPAIRKFLQGSSESLRVFKEFYIPTESSSVHFLKSKLCVGCTKGFEIVDLETLDTQGLLDPADSSLDFVQKRENARPIAIYRIEGDFLLCYDEFAFYVNKNGWRAKSNWIIQWEGFPTHFALHYPYVLAFEPTFVEVRHVESGALMQIISGNNLKCLFADSPPSTSSSSISQSGSQYYPSNSSQYAYTGGPNSNHLGSSQSRFPSNGGNRPEIILSDGDRIYSLQVCS